jgi:hypothetical protein
MIRRNLCWVIQLCLVWYFTRWILDFYHHNVSPRAYAQILRIDALIARDVLCLFIWCFLWIVARCSPLKIFYFLLMKFYCLETVRYGQITFAAFERVLNLPSKIIIHFVCMSNNKIFLIRHPRAKLSFAWKSASIFILRYHPVSNEYLKPRKNTRWGITK